MVLTYRPLKLLQMLPVYFRLLRRELRLFISYKKRSQRITYPATKHVAALAAPATKLSVQFSAKTDAAMRLEQLGCYKVAQQQ